LVLGQTVGASQNAKLLPKGRDCLTARLVAALDMLDGSAFHDCVDAKELALLEQSQNSLVGVSFGCRSRILAIASYRHRQPPFIADACAGVLEKMP
jgi:hypothetical protein